jgi:hypothetical protein
MPRKELVHVQIFHLQKLLRRTLLSVSKCSAYVRLFFYNTETLHQRPGKPFYRQQIDCARPNPAIMQEGDTYPLIPEYAASRTGGTQDSLLPSAAFANFLVLAFPFSLYAASKLFLPTSIPAKFFTFVITKLI